MDIRQLTEELGSPENLEDGRVRLLLATLLEQWFCRCDEDLERRFLQDVAAGFADSIRFLLELNRTKNSLLGMASHDLRNPLLSIRGLAEILLTEVAGGITEDQRTYLSIISSASNGMLALVNDLLDVSIIESGKVGINRVIGALRPLAEERLQVYRAIAEEKGIGLTAHYGELPDFAFDPTRLGQAIDNLLSNAVKFSPPGSRIEVFLEKEGRWVRFTVVDKGPGIPPEDLRRIFDEFEKSKGKPTGGEKSTGLGLAITKKIIEAHGGHVSVCNGTEGGAVFTLHLPL